MFSGASNFANGVDKTFLFIIGVSLFFLIGLTVVMIVFAIKYNKKRHPKAIQFEDNATLEIVWTVIPTILVLLMFYYGYINFIIQREVPKDAIPVTVISKMWDWTFDHGNGKIKKDTLIVPVGKAVNLNLVSYDVNHSFYVPAFRIKEDVVRGKPTNLWFIAERPGNFEIFCAEFCGLRHSYMIGVVKSVPENEYREWLANLPISDISTTPKGLIVMEKNGCFGCHSRDGSVLIGPSFKDIYGTEKIVEKDGKEIKVIGDSAYIRNSIINPNDEIVKGFSKGLMKSYKGVIDDNDISEIIKYLKATSERKD